MNFTGKLSFYPLGRSDFPLLSEWLATPHVACWWADDASAEAIEAIEAIEADHALSFQPTHAIGHRGGR